jgi:putative flippase GtrA
MITRELAIFLIVGSMSILVDFVVYNSILRSTEVGVNVAKASSFLVGTVLTYFAHRLLTFGHINHQQGSSWRFGLLYGLTLSTNVIVNTVALTLLRDARMAAPLAFLTATGISASLNFLGMKWFVFRTRILPEFQ